MTAHEAAEVAPQQPVFYPVGLRKFAVMHAVTFGLYELQWFYENWWLIKLRRSASFNPGTRTALAPLFVYPLFRAIRSAADEVRVPTAFSPLGAYVTYLVGLLCGILLIDDLWPAALVLTYVPLHVPQHVAIQVNAIRAPDADPNDRFSWSNRFALAVGGILFVFALWASYFRLREGVEGGV